MGFSERDRIDLVKIMAETEGFLDSKRLTNCFDEHFFQTNFWIDHLIDEVMIARTYW
jgi:oleate hydratase